MFDFIVRVKIMVVAAAFLAATPFAQASEIENNNNDYGFVHIGTPLPNYFLSVPLSSEELINQPELLQSLQATDGLRPLPLLARKDIQAVSQRIQEFHDAFHSLQHNLKDQLPEGRSADPQPAIALLLTYYKQWNFLQHQAHEIIKRIRQLQQDTTDNQAILEHMRLNPTWFPSGESTVVSAWNYLTKDTEKAKTKGHVDDQPEEAKSALCQGVYALQAHLTEQNHASHEEIHELLPLYQSVSTGLMSLKCILNSPDILHIMNRARIAAEDNKSILHQRINALGNQLEKHLLDMLEIYNHDPKITETELIAKIHNANHANEFEAIYYVIRDKYFTSDNLSDKNKNRASEMLARKLVAAIIELRECFRTHANTHKIASQQIEWLRALPGQAVLSAKAAAQTAAVDDLIKSRQNEDLLNALHTLQNGLCPEMVQIANNTIEENLSGFTAENFVRWILVNKTHQLVPMIARSAITYSKARLGKLDPKLLEDNHEVKLLDTSGRDSVTALHFPKATELQNSKGKVADALVCVIKNLPRECFIEEMKQFLVKTLEDSDRKEWVKSIGGYLAASAAGKMFDAMQQRIIGHIQEKAGDPSLLPLCCEQIDALLAARAADGDDQTGIIAKLLDLRKQASTSICQGLTNLGLWQDERPALASRVISGTTSSLASWGSWLTGGTQDEDDEIVDARALTWDEVNAQRLNGVRDLLLSHVQSLSDLRADIRGKQKPGTARVQVMQ